MSYDRPDNRGIFAGTVEQTDRNRVQVLLEETLSVGDGYLLLRPDGEEVAGKVQELYRKGRTVTYAEKGQTVTLTVNGNPKGCRTLYRTAEKQLLQRAMDSFSRPSEPGRTAVHFKIELHLGQPISLFAWDDAQHQAYAESDYKVELARTQPSTEESIRKQLERLGNTGYYLGDLVVELEDGLIAPSSELNQLRRTVIAQLEAQHVEKATEQQTPALESYEDYMENAGDFLDRIPPQVFGWQQAKLSVHTGTVAGAEAAAKSGAQVILLNGTALRGAQPIHPEDYGAVAELCHAQNAAIYWTCSPIAHDKQMDVVQQRMLQAKAAGFDGVLVGNVGLLRLAQEMEWNDIAVDYSMNVMNDITLQYLSSQQVSRVTLSPELSLEEIEQFAYLGNLPLELMVQGNFPLMVSEHCVAGAIVGGRTAEHTCKMPCTRTQYQLQDRLGMQFPLRMDENCRMHVYNCKQLSLYKRMEAVLKTGIDMVRLELRDVDEATIGKMTSIYRRMLDQYASTGTVVADLTDVQWLEKIAPQGSTYGHYFRGVQ